jgi:hypothetical protein
LYLLLLADFQDESFIINSNEKNKSFKFF